MLASRSDIRKDMIKRFNLKTNASMAAYTSFKIGGPAELLAIPESRDEISMLLHAARQNNLPVHIFGGGTNILVSDEGLKGLVILTRRLRSEIKIIHSGRDHKTLHAMSGELLSSVCRFAMNQGLSGLEFAAGIPGTLGGALMMNAGTPDGRMSDVVSSLEILDINKLSFYTIDKNDLSFSYRNLELDDVIIGADLKFSVSDRETVKADHEKFLLKKKSNQPVSQKSAGCFFKNPDKGDPAGKLIEDAGFKGKKINDAMVSDVHANYIVNTGKATCKDVMALKEQIRKTVYEKFGIQLETEVRVHGES